MGTVSKTLVPLVISITTSKSIRRDRTCSVNLPFAGSHFGSKPEFTSLDRIVSLVAIVPDTSASCSPGKFCLSDCGVRQVSL